ncbi:MAG: glycoside hydrolase family 3 protein [Clostridium sp.]|nr:glycoside hydrolase family 3 protein [Clostridium sp.]
MDGEQERQRRRRSRARSRRRRQAEKRRRFLILTIAVLAAVILAAAGALTGGRNAGTEDAEVIHPELLPGDDTGIGLGGISENSGDENGGDSVISDPDGYTENRHENEQEVQKEAQEEAKRETEADTAAESMAEKILSSMTLEEQIFQLFMVTPEALTGYDEVYAAGEATKDALWDRPAGGIIYFSQNLKDEVQTREMLSKTAQYGEERSGLPPFLAVDEEGGQVARISGKEGFSLDALPDMSEVGACKEAEKAFEVGDTIGRYLADLGFDVDFAPVADILTNPDNTVVSRRSFGSDAEQVSGMVSEEVKGLKKHGVSPVLKHFPGHGGTAEDSHDTKPVLNRTLEELSETEFLPFISGIESGADFVMVGHISVPEIEKDGRPAVFSKTLVTDILREQLGFEGIVITDAMNMGAVTESYDSGEAAVKALLAGADMILMPENFDAAVQAVKDAVENGTLTKEQIEESAMRILTLKAEKNMEREGGR